MSASPTRISELTQVTPQATDQIPIARGSGAGGQTLKINVNSLASYIETAAPSHILATTFGLGPKHTVNNLTTGQVLRATGPSSAAFQKLNASDIDGLGSLTAIHVLATNTGLGPLHTISGTTAGQVLRATGSSSAAFQKLNASDIDGVGSLTAFNTLDSEFIKLAWNPSTRTLQSFLTASPTTKDGSTFIWDGGSSSWKTGDPETTVVPEAGFVKSLAKQTCGAYSGCTFTKNSVQIWGRVDGNSNSGDHKFKDIAVNNMVNPERYLKVPFHSSYNSPSNQASNLDYLDLNPTVTIVEVIWNWCCGMALLSDNTVWVIGLNDTNGLGLGGTSEANKQTHGFCQVQLPGYVAGTKITKIQCRVDNDNQAYRFFGVLDESGNFWRWGRSLDNCFGGGTLTNGIMATPTLLGNSTSVVNDGVATRNFQQRVIDFEFTGAEASGSCLGIIANLGTSVNDPAGDKALYFAGDNAQYQLGKGTANTTSQAFFVRAQKMVQTATTNQDAYDVDNAGLTPVYINNATKIGRSLWAGRLINFYIDADGIPWSCGYNLNGQGGVRTTADKYPFPTNTADTVWKGRGYFCKMLSLSNQIVGRKAIDITCAGYYRNSTKVLFEPLAGQPNLYGCGSNHSSGYYIGTNTTEAEVTILKPCYRRNSNNNIVTVQNAKKLYFSDNLGGGDDNLSFICDAYIDESDYAWFIGRFTYTNPPENTVVPYYTSIAIPNVVDLLLSGNIVQHLYTMIHTKKGIVWGIGDVAANLYGFGTDQVRLPCRVL